jgi:Chaperone of endosialidase
VSERPDRPSGSGGPATRKLAGLRGVSWRWREDAPAQAKAQPQIGVIAQEVERAFPELVTTDQHGWKRVDYLGLIAPLLEAVKELDSRLSALEAKLSQHEAGHGND